MPISSETPTYILGSGEPNVLTSDQMIVIHAKLSAVAGDWRKILDDNPDLDNSDVDIDDGISEICEMLGILPV